MFTFQQKNYKFHDFTNKISEIYSLLLKYKIYILSILSL